MEVSFPWEVLGTKSVATWGLFYSDFVTLWKGILLLRKEVLETWDVAVKCFPFSWRDFSNTSFIGRGLLFREVYLGWRFLYEIWMGNFGLIKETSMTKTHETTMQCQISPLAPCWSREEVPSEWKRPFPYVIPWMRYSPFYRNLL